MLPPTDQPSADTVATADCCRPSAAVDPRIARHFDHRLTEQTVDGELPELIDVSAMLLGLMGDVAAAAPTVLELGCGSGALSVELCRRGAQRVDGIDLSPAMIAAAGERAEESGVSERASFTVGDGALVSVAPRDWVVLDRVLCCYPNLDALLSNALAAAPSRVLFSVPTSRGWRGLFNRLAWFVADVPARVRRNSCPTFVHDIGRIEGRLRAAGFARRAEARLGLWYAAAWDGPAAR